MAIVFGPLEPTGDFNERADQLGRAIDSTERREQMTTFAPKDKRTAPKGHCFIARGPNCYGWGDSPDEAHRQCMKYWNTAFGRRNSSKVFVELVPEDSKISTLDGSIFWTEDHECDSPACLDWVTKNVPDLGFTREDTNFNDQS